LFAIPVATFDGVDRWSEDLMEVVAGAHVYPADPIGLGSRLMLLYLRNFDLKYMY
jgi:hypothetical protein